MSDDMAVYVFMFMSMDKHWNKIANLAQLSCQFTGNNAAHCPVLL